MVSGGSEEFCVWGIASFRWYELLIEYHNIQNANQCPEGLYILPHASMLGHFQLIIYRRDNEPLNNPIRLELSYGDDRYPSKFPIVMADTQELDHPFLDSDGRFRYERLIPEQASVSLTNALYAIQRAICDTSHVIDRKASLPKMEPM